MGILGLTSFIDQHTEVFQDHILTNTKVIIDGNNFYHILYYRFSIEEQFGGDYDEYSDIVRWVFNVFRTCAIDPIIVFDGAMEPDNRKLQTIKKRAGDRIMKADSIRKGSSSRIVPLMCYSVFQQVLNDLGISYIQADFEADDQIAVLANEYQVPVLSNDSDFYVFNIPHGFIPIDYLSFHTCDVESEHLVSNSDADYVNKDMQNQFSRSSVSNKGLKCQIYYVESFIARFDLVSYDHFYFIMSLLGNDITDASMFLPFFHYICSRPQRNMSNSKLDLLIRWLKNLQDPVAYMNQFLLKFKQDLRQSVENAVRQSMNGYSHLKEQYTLKDFILNKYPVKFSKNNRLEIRRKNHETYNEIVSDRYKDIKINASLYFFNRTLIPDWFIHESRNGFMSPNLLSIMIHKKDFKMCQVEDMNKTSSQAIANIIYRSMYSIVCPKPTDDSRVFVTVFDRSNTNLKHTEVEVEYDNTLPSVSKIPLLTYCERLDTLYRILNVEGVTVTGIWTDLKLLICCLMFWIRFGTGVVQKYHVKAVIVSILFTFLRSKFISAKHKGKKRTKLQREEIEHEPDESLIFSEEADLLKKSGELQKESVVSQTLESAKIPVQAEIGLKEIEEDIDILQDCSNNKAQISVNLCPKNIAAGDVKSHEFENERLGECNLQLLSSCADEGSLNLEELYRVLKSEEILQVYAVLEDFRHYIAPSKKQRHPINFINGDIIHSVAALQTVINAASILNKLLICPLKEIILGNFFNGTSIYQLCSYLKAQQSGEDDAIFRLLCKNKEICQIYEEFYAKVTCGTIFQPSQFDSSLIKTGHRSRKNHHHRKSKH